MTKDQIDAVEYLSSIAGSYRDDLESGLEDGIFEEGQENVEGILEATIIVEDMVAANQVYGFEV